MFNGTGKYQRPRKSRSKGALVRRITGWRQIHGVGFFMGLVCFLAGLPGLYAADEWDEVIEAPYKSVLTVNSTLPEKQITTEMLGAVLSTETVYLDDSTLLHTIREFQVQYKIPPYDYQYCLAGPMTLGFLVEKYINSSMKTSSFFRDLYMRYDPVKNPGVANLRGNDVVEFQVMYNTWAARHGNPPLLFTPGEPDPPARLEVDGYYGRFSRAAAIVFQKRELLLKQKDGIVNAKVWKLLYVRTYLARDSIVKQVLQWSNTHLP